MNMEYPVSTTVAPTTQEINKPFKRLELLNITTTTIRKYICTFLNFLLRYDFIIFDQKVLILI